MRRRDLLRIAPAALAAACARAPRPAPRAAGARRALFVGNSYTYYNNLPAVFAAFARALSPDAAPETDAVLAGGATLASHWERGEAKARLARGHVREIVLQEQSTLGGLRVRGAARINAPEERFFPAARRFCAEARAAGARPVFLMTWSRKAEPAAQAPLARAYAAAAREQGAALAPAGLAFRRVRLERPGLELYVEDGHHPGPAGTYLAACVLYATIFGRPCEGAPRRVEGAPWAETRFDEARRIELLALDEETARYLQRVGSEVALAAPAGPDPAEGPAIAPEADLPRLPEGERLAPTALAGHWTGSIELYPAERDMSPATFELWLGAPGERGRMRVSFRRAEPFEAPIDAQVEGDVLAFSVDDRSLLECTLAFRATLAGGALRGVVQGTDAPGGRWFGAWSAKR